MSRSRLSFTVRPVKPDIIYGSRLLSKLIASAMHDGDISASRKIVYGAISQLSSFIMDRYKESLDDGDQPSVSQSDAVVWFMESLLSKIAPTMETRSRRIGGMNYQIPYPVSQTRALSLSIRWLLNGARIRKERGMMAKLAAEMQDVMNNKGEAMKKREMIRKVVEANRPFAAYANMGNR